VLDKLWGGPETLVVISSDLSHYLPYEQARRGDDRADQRARRAAVGDLLARFNSTAQEETTRDET
jgi:AmmeMemoRadiSam system protein B